jgi:hypothetical protein
MPARQQAADTEQERHSTTFYCVDDWR